MQQMSELEPGPTKAKRYCTVLHLLPDRCGLPLPALVARRFLEKRGGLQAALSVVALSLMA